MLEWLRRRIPFLGGVLYRGQMPPHPGDFEHVAGYGVSAEAAAETEGERWALTLHHPQWGAARLVCPRDRPPTPVIVKFACGLSRQEQETALAAQTHLLIRCDAPRGNVLRDRKTALRFVRAVMGPDAVAGLDHLAQRVWTPIALDEELSHDAELDVVHIYGMHAVSRGEGQPVHWLHSHGLAEIGFFDFDILRPSEDLSGQAGDLLRAIAFAIVEGRVTPSTARFALSNANGDVRFVEVNDFHRSADAELSALRENGTLEYHQSRRAVLCEPAGGLLGRWSKKMAPAKLLSGSLDAGTVIQFSREATILMAARARATYELLRTLADEFAEFEFPVLVKLGYTVDGGDEDAKEHLWFQVHGLFDGEIDGTLVNQPAGIARLKEGDRGRHPVDLLTDWMLMTPPGHITPRSTAAARDVRERREELRAIMREHKRENASS